MKVLPSLLGLLLLALLVAFYYEHRKTTKLESTVAALTQDRDAINHQLRKLEQSVATSKARPGGPVAPEPPAPDRSDRATRPVALPAPEPVATPGVSITPPAGWVKNGTRQGSYVVGVDTLQTWGGMPSAYVKAMDSSTDSFGGMMQTTAAENFIGKRVRLSGWVKTEAANDGGGHLWLRVDGQQSGQPLQFDNMNNRAVKGTSDWQEASVVLDVPAGATALAYGFFVQGGGQMWVSGSKIEEVGPDVPSTNMQSARKSLPKAPQNLGFSTETPK